ncbi:MAG: DUF2905 domain-containing protein [Dehalococcoidia bacterium]|nr:DUF2905 domain-containing protein [Dehalococcoidia bacterium]
MDERSIGFLVAAIGVVVVIAGLLISTGALSWFGRLPGDFSGGGDNVRVFFPLTSMIILSVVLSLALYIVRRLF